MKRKKRPQPPKWFSLDTDNCWFCKNKAGCGGCKIPKRIVAQQKEEMMKK